MLPPRFQDTGHDLIAALALAAVAIPEQIATARLAGAPPTVGLLVFIAGSLGFFLLGSNRYLSVGADSTIAPIFASGLGLLGAYGSPHYLTLATVLALLVGLIVAIGGALRLGWIARLLSVPVITGFLAGIAIHIVVSQLPALMGISNAHGDILITLSNIAKNILNPNPFTLGIGLAVFLIIYASERIDIRLPGALFAMILATICVQMFGLAGKGVAVLGAVQSAGIQTSLPHITLSEIGELLPIALIVSLVVVIQTAATARSFQAGIDTGDLNRDLIGVGFGNVLSGIFGGFPANSSPPRTAIVSESGGKSRFAGFCACVVVAAFLLFGLRLLANVPEAALAGLLLFVAQRIFRFGTIRKIAAESHFEFVLLVATAAAIVVTPIETGVGIGVVLSLLHGVWTIAQTRAIEFGKLPGSTVWWPVSATFAGEKRAGVVVVGFQAPLFFLNAETFRRSLNQVVHCAAPAAHTIILEAGNIVELDFSGAQTLGSVIRFWTDQGVNFYVARLESVRAQQAFERFGILSLLGQERVFHSVNDIIKLLEPSDRPSL